MAKQHLDQSETNDQAVEIKPNSTLSRSSKALLVFGALATITVPFANIVSADQAPHVKPDLNKLPLDKCYLVKPGDTLDSIGQAMNPRDSAAELYAINNGRLDHPDELKPGDTVALAPNACDHRDAVTLGLAPIGEVGLRENSFFSLTVTQPRETIFEIAQKLHVREQSIRELNPNLRLNNKDQIKTGTLLVTPTSNEARAESHFVHKPSEFPAGTWQLVSTIDGVIGPVHSGTAATTHIEKYLSGKDVKAVVVNPETGENQLFAGQVMAAYEDPIHYGRFLAEVRTTCGNNLLVSLDSLLVPVDEILKSSP